MLNLVAHHLSTKSHVVHAAFLRAGQVSPSEYVFHCHRSGKEHLKSQSCLIPSETTSQHQSETRMTSPACQANDCVPSDRQITKQRILRELDASTTSHISST